MKLCVDRRVYKFEHEHFMHPSEKLTNDKIMKHSAYFRFSVTLLLLLTLLSPTAVLAFDGKGKKHFKEGMKAEYAEQWDKAVEEFALAVVDDPRNPEYRLHYQRSIFNASQMYMKRGTSLAEQKDYAGGYLAFRKAFAYDPTNELAQSEMERMLRLQKTLDGGENSEAKINSNGDVRLVPTGYQKQDPRDDLVPQRLEKYQDVPFPGGVDLQFLIKELAKNLDLNVLFDVESFRQERKIKIELKNVTPAKALDYIFLQEGLFFQKVGPRTILVATQNRRQQFQQLVLRTFYLANADPTEVSKLISTAIPVQPGRTPTTTLVDKSTNSITVRDTEENIRLIGRLIGSLDKDRAEVVMDVAIYEVSKSDLLKFGNQIGSESSLTSLGGTTTGAVGNNIFGRTGTSIIPRAIGVGLVIPAISLVAFQRKDNAKLLASTQIHAFNNEDSSARIGQRVPVRTATISNGFGGGGGTQPGTGGNGFLGDVINYEQVGLTLKFKPIVFPNQDVQVAMEIESKDVVAGGTQNNPVFSERTIKGTARIQNNKTLLLASSSTDVESNGREGLPLLGLIPVLGRLFSAPTKNNRQVDIVIAVTPRVIRAPAILPEDEAERPTGSLAVPTSNSLEAMIIREEVEEQLAAARRLPNVAKVQLPDQQPEAPVYVKSTSAQSSVTTVNTAQKQGEVSSPQSSENSSPMMTNQNSNQNSAVLATNLRPIDTSVKTLQITQTSLVSAPAPKKFEVAAAPNVIETASASANSPTAEITFAQALPKMKAGEKTIIQVLVKSGTAFRSAVMALKFNARKLAVRDVSFGEVFGSLAQTKTVPFLNQNGKMFVSLSASKDASEFSSGTLAFIEVEALADGTHEIEFDTEAMNLLTADGKNFIVKF